MENFNQSSFNSSSEMAVLGPIVDKQARDMSFVGIIFIIMGGMTCLTITGAIFGIPYIIMGLRLRESSQALLSYLASGNVLELNNAFEKSSSFFSIMKIFIIIGLALFALSILVIIMILITGGFAALQNSSY